MNQQSIKRQMVAGSIYAFSAQVVSTVAALAATALLARLLSPEDLGVYFIVFSVVSLASIICQFGLGRTVVRTIAESQAALDGSRTREVIRKSLLILALSASVVSVLMYFFAVDILATSVFGVAAIAKLADVLVLWFAMLALRGIVAEAFRGLHDLRGANLFGDMTTRCIVLLMFVAVWIFCKDVSVRLVIALNIAALAVTAASGLFVLHRKTRGQRGPSAISIASLASASWPVLITELANGARSQADVWLLGILSGAQSVAVYGAATRLAFLVLMPITVLSTVTAPYIASLYSSGRQWELQAMLTRTTAFATILATGGVVLYVVGGDQLLRMLYGDMYTKSYSLLVILAIGHLVAVAIGPSALTLMMMGHQKAVMVVTAVSAGMLVLGGFVFIRLFGPVGMALTNAAVVAAGTAICAIITHRLTGVWTHATIRSLAPSTTLAGARQLLQVARRSTQQNDKQ